MGIIWTIIIGFVAGVIAKFIMPGDNEPLGLSSPRSSASSAHSWRRSSGNRSAGIGPAKARG